MSSVGGTSITLSATVTRPDLSDGHIAAFQPLNKHEYHNNPTNGIAGADRDIVASRIATAMFEIEHPDLSANGHSESKPVWINPHLVDPLVEALCPCALEEMKALAWTLRSLDRRNRAGPDDREGWRGRHGSPRD